MKKYRVWGYETVPYWIDLDAINKSDAYQKALAIDSSNSKILHNMGVVQLQESTRTFIDLKNQTQPNDPLHIRAQLVINAIANLFYKEFEIEMEN